MSDFLTAVKADLVDRRLLPFLVLLGVALAAALGYAVLGGGGSSAPTPANPTAPAAGGPASIAVRPAQANPDRPVAETTSGSPQQHAGASRNPFTPLPGAKATTSAASASPSSSASGATAPTTSGSSTTSTKSSSPSSSTGSGGTSPSSAPKSSSPAKPHPVARPLYQVDVGFGIAVPGTLPRSAQLTHYENLKSKQALPSTKQPLLVFTSVTKGGKSATFTLVAKAIPRGSAACLPSPSRCEAINLKTGQTEELEYLSPNGTATTYQLRVLSISTAAAHAAAIRPALRLKAKSASELLHRIGLALLPGLH
jgi:hypothetical protein